MYLAAVMSWEDVYKIMAAGAVVGMAAILCSKEPKKEENYVEVCCEGNWHQRFACFIKKPFIVRLPILCRGRTGF